MTELDYKDKFVPEITQMIKKYFNADGVEYVTDLQTQKRGIDYKVFNPNTTVEVKLRFNLIGYQQDILYEYGHSTGEKGWLYKTEAEYLLNLWANETKLLPIAYMFFTKSNFPWVIEHQSEWDKKQGNTEENGNNKYNSYNYVIPIYKIPQEQYDLIDSNTGQRLSKQEDQKLDSYFFK